MPYGIYSVSDVCQNRISQMLENIASAANNQENIVNWSEPFEELQKRIIEAFTSLRGQGLELNRKKFLFSKCKVIF